MLHNLLKSDQHRKLKRILFISHPVVFYIKLYANSNFIFLETNNKTFCGVYMFRPVMITFRWYNIITVNY
jgi:hypothetical protein